MGLRCRDEEHDNRDLCSWTPLWPGEVTCTNEEPHVRADPEESVDETLRRWHCAPSDGSARWSVSLDMHCRLPVGGTSACGVRVGRDCFVVFDPGFAMLYGFLCGLGWLLLLILCTCTAALAWITHCCFRIELPFPSLLERKAPLLLPLLHPSRNV